MFCGLTFTKVSWSLPFAQNVWQWHIFVLIGILSGFRDTRRSIMEPGFSQLSNLPFSEKGHNVLSRTLFSISSLRILCILIYPSRKKRKILHLVLIAHSTSFKISPRPFLSCTILYKITLIVRKQGWKTDKTVWKKIWTYCMKTYLSWLYY